MSRKIRRYIQVDPASEEFNGVAKLSATFYRITPHGRQINGVFAELDSNEVRTLTTIGIYVRHPTAAERRLISTYDLQQINRHSTK